MQRSFDRSVQRCEEPDARVAYRGLGVGLAEDARYERRIEPEALRRAARHALHRAAHPARSRRAQRAVERLARGRTQVRVEDPRWS